MRRDYSSWVNSKVTVIEIFHDIVNEEIILEFFLEDQYLELGLYTVEGIKIPNLEYLRNDTRFLVVKDHIISILNSINFALETSVIFSDFECFKIGMHLINFINICILFYEVENGDCGILFLVDTSNYLTVMNVLPILKFGFFEGYFFILLFYSTILDCVVMDIKLSCHKQHFFLAYESDAEEITVIQSIFLC